jgi:hypothetical protein
MKDKVGLHRNFPRSHFELDTLNLYSKPIAHSYTLFTVQKSSQTTPQTSAQVKLHFLLLLFTLLSSFAFVIIKIPCVSLLGPL